MDTLPPPPDGLDRGGRQLRWLLVGGCVTVLLAALVLPALVKVTGDFHPCMFLRITGYPCMFCGMTRAFILMAHGHVVAAWQMSPLGVPLFCAMLAALGWGLACLVTGKKLLLRWRWGWLTLLGVLLLLANWIYRLSAGLK